MQELIDNRYEVISLLGKGGMAEVFLAHDRHLERKVAVKILDRRLASDEEFVIRFKREAKAAAGLNHPHIVNIHDWGMDDGNYYISMEYLEGETLAEIIKGEHRLQSGQAIEIALQVLDALQAAHANGIIHRDIKPQNIVIVKGSSVKVTDFGIAKTADVGTRMTTTGSILGTAQYLSPEQVAGQDAGAGSDIYSTGIVLYQMLTGRVPFEGDNLIAVAMKHINEEPMSPREIDPTISGNLNNTVLNALLKDPVSRYQNAREFIADLENCGAGREVLPRLASEAETDTARLAVSTATVTSPKAMEKPSAIEKPSGKRRKFLVYAAVAMFFLASAATAAGIYIVVYRNGQPMAGGVAGPVSTVSETTETTAEPTTNTVTTDASDEETLLNLPTIEQIKSDLIGQRLENSSSGGNQAWIFADMGEFVSFNIAGTTVYEDQVEFNTNMRVKDMKTGAYSRIQGEIIYSRAGDRWLYSSISGTFSPE